MNHRKHPVAENLQQVITVNPSMWTVIRNSLQTKTLPYTVTADDAE